MAENGGLVLYALQHATATPCAFAQPARPLAARTGSGSSSVGALAGTRAATRGQGVRA